jgi:hypothetical protein
MSPIPTTPQPLPMPRLKPKEPAKYMKRKEVERLCRRHQVSNHKARQLFFHDDSPARIRLTPGGNSLYLRKVVLDVLGLTDV